MIQEYEFSDTKQDSQAHYSIRKLCSINPKLQKIQSTTASLGYQNSISGTSSIPKNGKFIYKKAKILCIHDIDSKGGLLVVTMRSGVWLVGKKKPLNSSCNIQEDKSQINYKAKFLFSTRFEYWVSNLVASSYKPESKFDIMMILTGHNQLRYVNLPQIRDSEVIKFGTEVGKLEEVKFYKEDYFLIRSTMQIRLYKKKSLITVLTRKEIKVFL